MFKFECKLYRYVSVLGGPMIVPVSNVSLKSGENVQYPARIIQSSAVSSGTNSMVIRTQNGSSAGHNSVTPSTIQIPQITVSKSLHQPTLVSSPILSAQLKQGGTAVTNRPMYTIKAQTIPGQKQPELILLPPQQKQKIENSATIHTVQTQKHSLLQTSKPQQTPTVPNVVTQSHGISPPKSLMNTSILDHSGSRKRHDFDFDYSVER